MAETVADIIATHEPQEFVPLPTLAEATRDAKPRLTIVGIRPHTLAVACVDPRCSVDKFIDLNLGVPNGEMVMVCRNAGGHIRHGVRDILLLDARFGIDELVIVHHTDCGTLTFTDGWMRDALKSRLGKDHSQDIDQIYWGGNTE
ncbi:hypothetical protein M440DRAFT_1321589 [Trichoderma longibrachiatum ATCC 18648]|uniref:Carbonic anhydrase n=1 Tax=Trichoderma longibrachiatum ATCC 18648 TaxID=983965 RepID=A0A2T4CJV2_TRILO|nr:hypothetical protein M440DRAFT_1321589 [Trichoderma longibrachiatum ATCC 18648]